jgi:mono/diheme cytochrome c family protein
MRSSILLVAAIAFGAAGATHAAADGPPALDPAIVEQGRAIYQRQCASCHGPEGEGAPNWQQRNAQGELPAPAHDPEGHTWKHSDAMLYRIVREGWRDPFNKTERLTMPAFEEVLSPKEIRAVVTYLKTLWTPKQRRFQWEESRDAPFPSEAG